MSLSLAALLVAFVLLALAQTLRSNLHGIHKNLIGALFFSQLVFVIGIAQTENPVRPRPVPSPHGRLCGHVGAHAVPPSSEAGVGGLVRAECLLLFPSGGCSWGSGGKLGTQAKHVGSLLCARWESASTGIVGSRGLHTPRLLTFLTQTLVISSEITFVKPKSPGSCHLSLKLSPSGSVSQPCTCWGVMATSSVKAPVFPQRGREKSRTGPELRDVLVAAGRQG